MTLAYTGIRVELRDILLKDKPADMVAASPKATVPVLKCNDGRVLEESFDIMLWALNQRDPDGWLPDDENLCKKIFALVEENDGPFKANLDQYKYHVRFPDSPRESYRDAGAEFLQKLDSLLTRNNYLVSDRITFADIAIFPFIRQFANSDRDWFDAAPYPYLQKWLENFLSSEQFSYVMKKRPIWQDGASGPVFPELHGS